MNCLDQSTAGHFYNLGSCYLFACTNAVFKRTGRLKEIKRSLRSFETGDKLLNIT